MNVLPPLEVDGDVSALDAIADYVLSAGAYVGLDKRARYRLRLAVDEVATNVIIHGYKEHGRSGKIVVRSTVEGDMIVIRLEDTAPPYDPRDAIRRSVSAVPLEERIDGGLGLVLVGRSVDAFEYTRKEGGNVNALKVKLPPPLPQQDRTAHVLLAAHHPAIAELLEERLSPWPYVFTVVDSGKALCERAAREHVDLILISLHLPDLNGELCLRHLGEALMGDVPPVVVLMDEGHVDQMERCLGLGAYDFVFLTFPGPMLHMRLQSVIDRRRERERVTALLTRQAELEHLARDFTEVILPLGVALTEERDFDRLMNRVVTEAMAICNADAGTLYLREGDLLHFAVMHTSSLGLSHGAPGDPPAPFPPLPLRDPDTNRPNFRNVATWVALRQSPVNVTNIYDDALGFDFSGARAFDLQTGYRTVSCLTVPLLAGGDAVGVLQLLNALDEGGGEIIPFGEYHERVVAAMASQAAIAIHDHKLLEEQQHYHRLTRELQIGKEIQANFLPRHLPDVEGYHIAARFLPAREVSGDFYDAFIVNDLYLGFVVADVCDKGVGAALFMGLIRSLIRAFAQMDWTDTNAPLSRPTAALQRTAELHAVGRDAARLARLTAILQRGVHRTNLYVARTHGDLHMFATLFFGLLVPSSGQLVYINAGHPAPWIWTPGDPPTPRHSLPTTGPAIGVIPDATFEVGQAHLHPGELLLGYTDGLTDARAPSGERFGLDRVTERVRALAPWEPEGLLSELVSAVDAHVEDGEAFDDLSLLALTRDTEGESESQG